MLRKQVEFKAKLNNLLISSTAFLDFVILFK